MSRTFGSSIRTGGLRAGGFRAGKAALAALLLPALLTACTGTEEELQAVRLAMLTDGGRTLSYIDTPTSASPTILTPKVVSDFQGPAYSLLNFNTGSNVVLTYKDHLEQRDVNLAQATAFGPLPPDFGTCLNQTVMNAQKDRLLTLSDCDNVQQLALYRTDRTLVWTALLPTKTPPIPNSDTPPTRIAILGDVGLVARAGITGQSEVIRAAPSYSSDPVQAQIAVVSDPIPTVSIRDLAPFGGNIYAATDSGVRPLLATGVPDLTTTTGSVAAFGTTRVDRLWTGVSGSTPMMAAWRSNLASGTGSEALRLWNGSSNTARIVAYFSDLRDVTFDLNSQLYALSPNSLSRYDTLTGMTQNIWQPYTLATGLNDARAVTWLVP